jgi:SAM-dependent methyltransferase
MTVHPSKSGALFDQIGAGYSSGRREDARIAGAIWDALGDSASVVNVGAGAGSYEPTDRRVVAVEPSSVMIAQRPRGSAPAVQAPAEALPFPDDFFDASMEVLSLHHWSDQGRGLSEMRRVARRRVVLFLPDPTVASRWWLHHYFPATAVLEGRREMRIDDITHILGPVESIPVPIPWDCTDGFTGAYWRRPGAILDPQIWRPMSALAQIPDDDRRAGFQHLRADLDSGEWDRRWGDLLGIESLDLGYRVLLVRL